MKILVSAFQEESFVCVCLWFYFFLVSGEKTKEKKKKRVGFQSKHSEDLTFDSKEKIFIFFKFYSLIP